MVYIKEFSKKQVNKTKAYLMKFQDSTVVDVPESWNKRFYGYFNKRKFNDAFKNNDNQPLFITYTVPDGVNSDVFKKSLSKFKSKLYYYYNDVTGMYNLAFDQSGKVYAQMMLEGDNVPNKEWIIDALEEGYQHDAT